MTSTWRAITIGVLVVTAWRGLPAEEHPLPWQRGTYDPDWAEVAPRHTKRVTYNRAASETANGEALLRAFATLVPGDRLEVEAGRYVIVPKASLDLQGAANAPIWIVAADPDHPPVITRPDARQNLLNLGENGPCRYLALQNLELTGGSVVIRFYDCANVWLDRCELHHGQHGGITVNSRDTSFMFITRNHLHDFPSGTGEGMYLGANNSKVRMSYSVIAANHVHDCG